jgi:hypothetical protein
MHHLTLQFFYILFTPISPNFPDYAVSFEHVETSVSVFIVPFFQYILKGDGEM